MGVSTVPESFVYTCDACGAKTIEKVKVRWPRYWGTLTVAQDAHDFQGNAVADGTISRLLCQECLGAVSSFVNDAMEARRK